MRVLRNSLLKPKGAIMEDPIVQENLLLGAVNILLESINELPIEDEAEYENFIEARQARSKIVEVTRAVLAERWDFNTDKNYTFPLDSQGMIPVGNNVLDIVGNRGDVIMRNWKLYSRRNQSHVFDDEVPCDVVWLFDFNEISHPIRHYITIRAARIFMARTIGDKEAIGFNEVDEEDARLSARRSETFTGQHNMLKGTYGINNLARIN